ncbi:hypothetical protein MTR_1g027560 [Medicago truncatula]|uniref:Uncharacterized protein n=1 Tax=Medicago truncatula TaxID=3880 RepID=A0A072VEZ1_MEDTR|nr:hypothetical protein MTR_1g027560 [Medicago truncatula]
MVSEPSPRSIGPTAIRLPLSGHPPFMSTNQASGFSYRSTHHLSSQTNPNLCPRTKLNSASRPIKKGGNTYLKRHLIVFIVKLAIAFEIGDSIDLRYSGYDSLNDQPSIALDDGR